MMKLKCNDCNHEIIADSKDLEFEEDTCIETPRGPETSLYCAQYFDCEECDNEVTVFAGITLNAKNECITLEYGTLECVFKDKESRDSIWFVVSSFLENLKRIKN